MADERLHFMEASSVYNAMGASEHVVRYHCVRSLCQGKRVLDVACGEGYGSALLAGWGAAEVVGIDVSGEAIAVAQQMFARPTIQFLHGDACRLVEVLGDVPGFDLIVSFETIEHVTDSQALLSGIHRYRAPGGMVVISCPNDHVEEGDNPYHMRRYTFAEFCEITTEILGCASNWLLGTPAYGTLLYPAGDSRMENGRESCMTLLLECSELENAAVLPSQPNIAPQSTTCKFYVGCWGGIIPQDAVVSPQSFPAFIEPWRAVAWLKQELASKIIAQSHPHEFQVQLSTLPGQLRDLRIAKAAVDTQLAELRRRMQVHARAAQTDLRRVTTELGRTQAELERTQTELAHAATEVEHWRAFGRSRTYRLMKMYVSFYSLPVLGPSLRGVRRMARAALRGARILQIR